MNTIYIIQELIGNKWKPLVTTIRLTRRSGEIQLYQIRNENKSKVLRFRLAIYTQSMMNDYPTSDNNGFPDDSPDVLFDDYTLEDQALLKEEKEEKKEKP